MTLNSENIDVSYFINKIQEIVNKNQDVSEKKVLKYYPNKEHPKRINFACPYCGDSEKIRTKKRGNLWMNTFIVECYNCFAKKNFISFCKDFNIEIEVEDRIKIFNHIDSKTFKKGEDHQIENLNLLLPLDKVAEFVNTNKKQFLLDLKPVEKDSQVYKYLISRFIYDHSNIFQAIYQKFNNGKRIYATNVIVLLNRCGNKLLGMQVRNLEKSKEKRFFKIIDFEEIYNMMNPNHPLDELESIPYNKLSHFYNILNVNFDSTVTIFEGYLDSIFYPNSIGLVGANNDNDILKFLTEADSNLDLRFFYDNDATGHSKSFQMLNKNHKVFLWNKLFENLIKRAKDKYKIQEILKNIKDLNDLVIRFKNTSIHSKFKLERFFSEDTFDSIYIPISKK